MTIIVDSIKSAYNHPFTGQISYCWVSRCVSVCVHERKRNFVFVIFILSVSSFAIMIFAIVSIRRAYGFHMFYAVSFNPYVFYINYQVQIGTMTVIVCTYLGNSSIWSSFI